MLRFILFQQLFLFSLSSNSLLVCRMKVCFDFEELRQLTIPPLIKIDHLKVTSLGRKASVDYATFIDGLLWSCHPMTISVPPGSSFLNNFIKV